MKCRKRRYVGQGLLFFCAIAWGMHVGCSGARARPTGPPPEYEKPTFEPWDAGNVEDPLAAALADGERVDDVPSAGSGGAADAPAGAAGASGAAADLVPTR